MKEKVYVGMDLAKVSSQVAALDGSGEAIFKPFSVANSKEGIKKLLDKLKIYKSEQSVLPVSVCKSKISSEKPDFFCKSRRVRGLSHL
jgi:hypothetical protein